jgi:hypothetical protein
VKNVALEPIKKMIVLPARFLKTFMLSPSPIGSLAHVNFAALATCLLMVFFSLLPQPEVSQEGISSLDLGIA